MYKLCVALAFLAVAAAKPSWPLAYDNFAYPAEYPSVLSYPYLNSGLAYSAPVVSAPVVSAPVVSAPVVSTSVVAAPVVAAPLVAKTIATPVVAKTVAAPVVAKTVPANLEAELHSAPVVNYEAAYTPVVKTFAAPAYTAPLTYNAGLAPISTAYTTGFASAYDARVAPVSFFLKKK